MKRRELKMMECVNNSLLEGKCSIGYNYHGHYIFSITSAVNELWNIYFILRYLLEFVKYVDWINFYNRYMKEGDDF